MIPCVFFYVARRVNRCDENNRVMACICLPTPRSTCSKRSAMGENTSKWLEHVSGLPKMQTYLQDVESICTRLDQSVFFMVRVLSRSLQPIRSNPKENLEEILKRFTIPGRFYTRESNGKIRCFACALKCVMSEGKAGFCKVRFVKDGELRVPWGYVAGLQIDPIEKKPFFHVMPGSEALSWGMLGCDMRCFYCQNWLTSQALRDPLSGTTPLEASPEQLVKLALSGGAKTLVSTYNEPLISSEWNIDVFKAGRREGLHTAYVSNGNITDDLLDEIGSYLDYYKIDLKTFDDTKYRKLGTRLERVLHGIEILVEKGIWVELVTLIVPGYNDSMEELRAMARFISDLDPNIPWHVTAFHPDYKALDYQRATANQLIRIAEMGKEEGLTFVYAGNLPGMVK